MGDHAQSIGLDIVGLGGVGKVGGDGKGALHDGGELKFLQIRSELEGRKETGQNSLLQKDWRTSRGNGESGYDEGRKVREKEILGSGTLTRGDLFEEERETDGREISGVSTESF